MTLQAVPDATYVMSLIGKSSYQSIELVLPTSLKARHSEKNETMKFSTLFFAICALLALTSTFVSAEDEKKGPAITNKVRVQK